ncbi:MAG: M64 family metallopeptidase [Bacteroidales bacterium]
MIRNSAFTLFVALLLQILVFSCSKEEPLYIDVNSVTLTLPNYDGVGEVALQSNGNWTASVSASWCSIAPTSGKGDAIITVTLSDNGGERERSATLNIGGGEVRRYVKITQQSGRLQVVGTPVVIDKDGGESSFKLLSNSRWQILLPQEGNWLEVDPLFGEGDATVSVLALPNSGSQREINLSVKYGLQEQSVNIKQLRGVNSPPEAPTLQSPQNNSTNLSLLPPFRWSSSFDADGDNVTYLLQYSRDPDSWEEPIAVNDTIFYLSHYLEPNSRYWWRVAAIDQFSSSPLYHSEGTFTTGSTPAYFDSDFSVVQSHTRGAASSDIIFVGDGYTGEDFIYGGKFDNDMDEGIEAFFALEPYSSYREYFSIYKLAAYSRESGVSQSDRRVVKNSRFNTNFEGGSSMSIDENSLFNFVKRVLNIDEERLRKSLIVLVANQNRYGGTCWMWADGKAIAIVPVSRSTGSNSHYRNLIAHEAGGHGYAKLADEYVENEGATITPSVLDEYRDFLPYGFYQNVDITGDRSSVKWRDLFAIQGYSVVDSYEGAFYYSYGAWRPELNSAMRHNDLYFNAPSRAAIVKRILTVAGENFTMERFIGEDLLRGATTALTPPIKSVSPLSFRATAPPKIFR